MEEDHLIVQIFHVSAVSEGTGFSGLRKLWLNSSAAGDDITHNS